MCVCALEGVQEKRHGKGRRTRTVSRVKVSNLEHKEEKNVD